MPQDFNNQEYKNIKKHSKNSDIPLLRYDFDVNEYAGLLKKDIIAKWNKEIDGVRSKKDVVADLVSLFDHDSTLAVQKVLLFRVISSIEDLNEQKCAITSSKMATLVHHVADSYLQDNSKVLVMQDLSVLELSLLIAIKHHNDIYDGDPFNFEIILTRLHKFQNATGDLTTGPTDRAVVLKAFDVLKVSVQHANILMKFLLKFSLSFPALGLDCYIRQQFERNERIPNASFTSTAFPNR